MLESLGATRVEVEGPDLSKRIAETRKIDAVLDLVGNSTILDSLNMLRRGGRAGAEAYRRDIPRAEVRFLETGHFALETHVDEIAVAVRGFLGKVFTDSASI